MSAPGARAQGRRVVVVGGTSEIALAIVRELQRVGPREVMLLGRDPAGLERPAAQLRADGCARALSLPLRAAELERHAEVVAEASERLGGIDLVLIAVGVLGDRGAVSGDVERSLEVLRVNFLGAGSLLLHFARRLSESGGGTLVVLSSVAAERPPGQRRVRGLEGRSGCARAAPRRCAARPGGASARRSPGLRAHAHDARARGGAAGDHARGGRPGGGERARARQPHGVGARGAALGDAADQAVAAPGLSPDRAMNASGAPRDPGALRARRRSARRRRRVARLDVAIGLVLALVLVLATPGSRSLRSSPCSCSRSASSRCCSSASRGGAGGLRRRSPRGRCTSAGRRAAASEPARWHL
jgi:NAD(P)-dependent dehydrogenase (short-subunit alcohol dehydrogenase family)